ncbi:class I SAM-dependent methyltransferase [Agrobacterium larrymoorei]|uniref:class I SAM-dependent methyltransferase n=1 Tax=Agrobacterium larrymoorei TaxID=160699 RepID=UPI0015740D58|nr:class I SAM-dependent methyltransferase [Agrobacterium larrymoorei]NTJ43958.1 class I SAM-dependent methyltransferase [Agrobacterium larrymoorei]
MTILVLGPSNAGKSTFMELLKPHGLPSTFGSQIKSPSDVPTEGLLHYNLLHKCLELKNQGLPCREWNLLDEKILSDIMASGKIQQAVVIVTSIGELAHRASSRSHVEQSLGTSGYNPSVWLDIMKDVDFFTLYEKTFDLLESKGISYDVLYSSNQFGAINGQLFVPTDRTFVHHNLRGRYISTPSPAEIDAVMNLPGRDYQRVLLPRNITTDSKDFDHVAGGRSQTFHNFRDRSFVGRSVLDIGCALGDFLFRAERYGATTLTGIELHPPRWEAAVAVAAVTHSKAVIHRANFMNVDLHNQFDDVLALNVLHHVPDFKGFLEKAVKLTKQRLIIEYPTLKDPKFQALGQFSGSFEDLPVIGVSSKAADQTFVYTQAALTRLVADYGDFRATSYPSPIEARKIVVFERVK